MPPKLVVPTAAATSPLLKRGSVIHSDELVGWNSPPDVVPIRLDVVVVRRRLLRRDAVEGFCQTPQEDADGTPCGRTQGTQRPYQRTGHSGNTPCKNSISAHVHLTAGASGTQAYLKWLPPMRLSKQVPTSALPKSWRSSTVWLTEPWPSPKLAENGFPRWMPKHSVELEGRCQLSVCSTLYLCSRCCLQPDGPRVVGDAVLVEDRLRALSGDDDLRGHSSRETQR